MCSLLGNLKKFNVGHGARKHDHFVGAVLYQSWVGRSLINMERINSQSFTVWMKRGLFIVNPGGAD